MKLAPLLPPGTAWLLAKIAVCKIDTHNKQEAHSEADAILVFDNFDTICNISSEIKAWYATASVAVF